MSHPAGREVFRVGASGWVYAHWKGRFYPQTLPQSRWFAYYAERFATVEVNATFYRWFKDETYLKWREAAPEGFCYALKAPRAITHEKLLADVTGEIERFWRQALLLGDRLAMVLLQLAPHMPYAPEQLRTALQAFPEPARVAVEFRNLRWRTPEIIQLLEEAGASCCNPDSPQERLSGILTSDRAYLRLHGRTRWYAYDYSAAELAWIAAQARSLAERGAQEVYIFFNNDIDGSATANALALQKMLA